MRLVDVLIKDIREESDNNDYGDNNGIPDSIIVKYLNDAQDRLASLITAKHPMYFVTEEEVNAVANQEAYSVTGKLYLGSRIHAIDYSSSGETRDYIPLRQTKYQNRAYGDVVAGHPCEYIRRGSQFLSVPAPNTSTGKFRVSYEQRLKRLDFRRAQVNGSVGSGTITSITVDNAHSSVAELLKGEYISIVDEFGASVVNAIPVNVGSTSTVIQVDSFALTSTIPDDSYVVFGDWASTNSELEIDFERYLIAYAVWKILRTDNSQEKSSQRDEVAAMEADIEEAVSEADMDVHHIPTLDEDIL